MALARTVHDGRTVNTRTEAWLTDAEKRLGYQLTVLQGSYNRGVGASAGTHDGGGAVDLAPYDHERKVRVLRALGIIAWYRPAKPGVWGSHIHAIDPGDPELSPAARRQVDLYRRGFDGLASMGRDPGPAVGPVYRPPKPAPFPKFRAHVRDLAKKTNDPGRKRWLLDILKVIRNK